MVIFQDYCFTTDREFAAYAAKSKLTFLYVHNDSNDTSLIDTIRTEEQDELYLSVDISKVSKETQNVLISLNPIEQKIYNRQKRDLPYLQTFLTGTGFIGTAFEKHEAEALLSRSRAEKLILDRFYRSK